MRPLSKAIAIALLMGLCAAAALAQDKGAAFPSDSDITLVVLQADAAMDQYRDAVGQEETVMGKAGADAVSRDKVLLGAWDYASKGFKSRPQTFNGELGFEVVLVLDDASRNAALCSGAAVSKAPAGEAAQNRGGAEGRAELARKCTEASTHLHAASQSASALYRQYLEAEQARSAKGCP